MTSGSDGEKRTRWHRRLARVRRHLVAGEVSQARRALKTGWDGPLPVSPVDLVDVARCSEYLGMIFGWRRSPLAWIGRAERAVARCGASRSEKSRALLLLEGIRARHLCSFGQPTAAKRFFRKFLVAVVENEDLWAPWISNFRLATLIESGQVAEADAFLRESPLPSSRFPPLEAGVRLRHLGYRLALSLDSARAQTALAAAEKKLLCAERPAGDCNRAHCIVLRARLYAQAHRMEEAGSQLERAREIGNRLRNPVVLDFVRVVESYIERQESRHDRYLKALFDTTLPFARREEDSPARHIQSLLTGAKTAVEAGQLSAAEKLLENAEVLLREHGSARLRAYHEVFQSDLALRRGTAAGIALARKHLDRAAALRERTPADGHLHCYYLLSRGWLALAQGQPSRALRHCADSLERARACKALDRESESLFLQSALLLEKNVPRSRLYDRTLNRLGIIRDPELLFRVLANLYLYTWDLKGEGIEMADVHIKQLRQMQRRLSEERFRELYQQCVTRPLVSRMRQQLLGG